MMEKRKTMLSLLLKINKLYLVVAATLLCICNTSWATDFESIYQSALKTSTELAKIRASSEEASANYKSTLSEFMPKAGVEARYDAFDSDMEKVDGSTSNAFVEWNLFNGFKDSQNRKSLKAESQAVFLNKERVEKNFRVMLMAKYARAKSLQENVELYQKVIASNLKNLQTVKVRRSSGRLSEADYLEFELFDAKLKQDLVALEMEAMNAQVDLESFAGVSPITALTTTLHPKPLDLDSLAINELLAADRAKVFESKLKVDSFEAKSKAAIAGYLPEVNIRATYGSQGLREAVDDPESTVGVIARWELFSGFETKQNRHIASAQLAKAKAEYESDKIENKSRALHLRNLLKSILERIEFESITNKNVDQFLNSVQLEYRRGAKSSSDLKSALELVLDTQTHKNILRADYFAARAELQDLLGIEIKEQ